MNGLRGLLVATSVAFAVFSGAYGAKYDEVRHAGGFSWSARSVDRTPELESIHATVKPVSIVYFLFSLGLFARAVRRSPWRKLCVLGIVASAFMTFWSALLSGAVSFDEVYPAWVVAAAVIGTLQLVVSSAARPESPAPATAGA
jgi:hypothetical protein